MKVSVVFNFKIDLGTNGIAHLFGDLTEESGTSRKERDASKDLRWYAKVTEDRTTYPCSVEWQGALEDLWVDSSDRCEECEVRSEDMLGLRKFHEGPRTGV